jgi:hypothetical protein
MCYREEISVCSERGVAADKGTVETAEGILAADDCADEACRSTELQKSGVNSLPSDAGILDSPEGVLAGDDWPEEAIAMAELQEMEDSELGLV